MAWYRKRTGKNGEESYYIYASDGYDSEYRQRTRQTVWKPKSGMTERQIEKELQHQMYIFDEQVKRGSHFDNDTRFGEYADKWLLNNRPPLLAPKTYERYESMLTNIKTAIGEIKLSKLQSHHLNEFYSNLREQGIKQTGTYAVSKELGKYLAENKLTKAEVASAAGLSTATLSAACKPLSRISIASAEHIAAALGKPIDELFELHTETSGLSAKTILHHHRLISTILAQATRDRLIPFNPADKNYMKAPRVDRDEAAFLDDEQTREVLRKLDKEPLKWKTAMYLLIYSGMRRGELMGLEWKDIDFVHKVIRIRNTSQCVKGMGIVTKCPKTATSIRTIKLADCVFDVLKEYRREWQFMKKVLQETWKDEIEITLIDGSRKIIRNDRVFIKEDSTPMHPDSITEWVRKFVQKNDLPYFSPHSLRHTHATLLIAEGVNIPTVSRRLGHSSIATTTKVYLHAIQSADEIASDVLEDKLNLLKPEEDKDDAEDGESE